MDEEQVGLISSENNGLPKLDLTRPGDPCPNTQMCRMLCLVCGKSMADGDDQRFAQLVDLLDRLEEETLELREEVMTEPGLHLLAESMRKDMQRRHARALGKYGLAWIERWCKPVHKHCSKETPCQCVVPARATMCTVHKRRLPLTRPPSTVRQKPNMQSGGDRHRQAADMKSNKDSQAKQNNVQQPVLVNKLSKATWLQKPTEMASTSSSFRASPAAAGPVVSKKRKPLAPKPNPRLESAAASCQKIEAFTQAQSCKAKQEKAAGSKAIGGDEEEYDLEWHAANFDQWKHGDFWKNGTMWFLRPDGKIVPSFEGVRQFTKSGYLVPG